jgi:hypothetical protein
MLSNLISFSFSHKTSLLTEWSLLSFFTGPFEVCLIFLKGWQTEFFLAVVVPFSFHPTASALFLFILWPGEGVNLSSCSRKTPSLWGELLFMGTATVIRHWCEDLPVNPCELTCFLQLTSFTLSLSTLICCPGALIFLVHLF